MFCINLRGEFVLSWVMILGLFDFQIFVFCILLYCFVVSYSRQILFFDCVGEINKNVYYCNNSDFVSGQMWSQEFYLYYC